jgi:hypothetical protein
MAAKDLMAKMKEQALKDVETLLKNQVEVAYDEAIELASKELAEKIPGQVDDAVINMVVAALAPTLKAKLLEQIEKVAA